MDGNLQQFECFNCHRNLINQRNLDAHQKYMEPIINQGIIYVKNVTYILPRPRILLNIY